MKKIIFVLSAVAALSGCAELNSLNDAVGNVAGQLNSVLGKGNSSGASDGVYTRSSSAYRYNVEDFVVSSKNIDTLYVKIKRNLLFKTRDEELNGLSGFERKRYEELLDEQGHAHETTPGVYYHMVSSYRGHRKVDMTLAKEDGKVRISWIASSNEADFGQFVKSEVIKAIK
ncbi:membrane lipoprotein lipid attachment site-containing protein [uncultured Aggregatibacter sp.]|uniref:membrane lipoprotein lipid attachment site-containing protein n=1 Tax=uncultured Aggregatibacter sp. TaxID=470564 RepID=UPI001A459DF5|nr:membrane lipoprotein lipid attachment site-containing protein [uncultured Aggregatibacter sp.]VTX59744.1 Uncharacterised protein [uncultured Aggregatibacter sp.]